MNTYERKLPNISIKCDKVDRLYTICQDLHLTILQISRQPPVLINPTEVSSILSILTKANTDWRSLSTTVTRYCVGRIKAKSKPFTIGRMYIHLTAHSAFSLQEGLMTPAALVQAAQASGMPVLGLTDRNLLTGVIEFVMACKAAGIQPIIGLEINTNDGPLHLLATSLEGWSNLCRLSSTIALRDDPEAPCSFDLLSSYSKDLIALSSEPESLKNIFADHLYINIQDPKQAEFLSDLAHRLALPCVVTHPVYYLSPDQATLQRTLAAVRLNQTIDKLPSEATAPSDSHFLSAQEMETRFKEYPKALAATLEIAERCKFDLPIGGSQMPIVPLPSDTTATQHLREKAVRGARELYGEITPAIQDAPGSRTGNHRKDGI